MQAFFQCHPWDLDDEGIDVALSRLAGDIGVDAVSVTAVAPRIEQFRRRPIGSARTITQPAAVHFQPDASRSAATRIRPIPAAWMKTRNPLEKIAASCEKNRLGLRVRVSLLRNDALVARNPMAALINAFGEPSAQSMCPSNPDVREYIVGLLDDLATNYPVAAVEVEDVAFEPATDLLCSAVYEDWLGTLEAGLLALCFCPACRQRAGEANVDMDALAETVRGTIDHAVNLEDGRSVHNLLGSRRDLRDFLALRREVVISLLRQIRSRFGGRLLLYSAGKANRNALLFDVKDLSDAPVDGTVIMKSPGRDYPAPSPDREPRHVRMENELTHVGRTEIALRVFPPAAPDAPALVRATQAVIAAGHPAVGFSDYGTAPAACLDWVRQAIRYARRESQ